MFMHMLFNDKFIHGDLHPGNMLVRLGEDGKAPELVILDMGLTVAMQPKDQKNFVDLLHAVAMKDGPQAGRLMVERTPGDRSAVIDEDVFVERVGELVSKAREKGFSLGAFGLGEILTQMLHLAYAHRVKLETSFVTVVTSIIVVEGVGRQLDSSLDIFHTATPWLVKLVASYALNGPE